MCKIKMVLGKLRKLHEMVGINVLRKNSWCNEVVVVGALWGY